MTTAPGTPAHAPRLVQLDGLRGIAALMIMLYHVEMVFHSKGPFVRGYLLVDFFFLLSGFVLAVATERKLKAGVGALAFTRARFVRMWPIVAVGATIGALRGWFDTDYDPLWIGVHFLLALAMIPNLGGAGPLYRVNGPQWSLLFELIFNYFHALVLKRLSNTAMMALAALCGAALIWVVQGNGSDAIGPESRDWYLAFPRIGWAYLVGVVMGRLYLKGLRTPGLHWPLALVAPVVSAVIVVYLPLGKANGDLLAALVLLPASLWLGALCRPPQALAPALDWLGAFSFPLYAVHLSIIVPFANLGNELWVRLLAMATALAVAVLASKYISFGSGPPKSGGGTPKVALAGA